MGKLVTSSRSLFWPAEHIHGLLRNMQMQKEWETTAVPWGFPNSCRKTKVYNSVCMHKVFLLPFSESSQTPL